MGDLSFGNCYNLLLQYSSVLKKIFCSKRTRIVSGYSAAPQKSENMVEDNAMPG